MTPINRLLQRFPLVCGVLIALLLGAMWSPLARNYAQGQGPSTQPGQVFGVNNLAPSSLTNVGGAVSNSSGLIIAITPGALFCNGSVAKIHSQQVTLLANTTYLAVFNCPQEMVYVKTAVTAPGVGAAPGTPATLLYAYPGVEVPLATIVCGASTCGTITDQRPLGNFSIGDTNGVHVLNPAANGDTDFLATLVAGTVTKTFNQAFQATPVCVATPTATGTFTTGAKLTLTPSTTQVIITSSTGTDTAAIGVHCAGNPN